MEHGQCHRSDPAQCGSGAGTRLMVRDCINSKTCPQDLDPGCDDVLTCSSLFSFEDCDIPCEDREVSVDVGLCIC